MVCCLAVVLPKLLCALPPGFGQGLQIQHGTFDTMSQIYTAIQFNPIATSDELWPGFQPRMSG